MDIQENLQSTIHRIDGEHFLEEIYHTHSRETDYWLGTCGSEKRVWLGDHMTLEQALAEAEEMTDTRPCEKHGELGRLRMKLCAKWQNF